MGLRRRRTRPRHRVLDAVPAGAGEDRPEHVRQHRARGRRIRSVGGPASRRRDTQCRKYRTVALTLLDYHALSKTGLDVWAVSFGTAPLGDMFGIADEATAISSVHHALTGAIHDAFHEGAVLAWSTKRGSLNSSEIASPIWSGFETMSNVDNKATQVSEAVAVAVVRCTEDDVN